MKLDHLPLEQLKLSPFNVRRKPEYESQKLSNHARTVSEKPLENRLLGFRLDVQLAAAKNTFDDRLERYLEIGPRIEIMAKQSGIT